MRIICINGAYPFYIKKFYENHKNLYKGPYAEQRAVLDYDAFAWADFWSHALSQLGYEVMEVTSNIEPLQKAWAAEHLVRVQEQTWKQEIILAQIKQFRPAVFFNADYLLFRYPELMAIKAACPSLRCALVFCNSPGWLFNNSLHNGPDFFQGYDVVLSGSPLYLEEFRRRGHQAEQLMHAFDPRVLDRINRKQEPFINFSFIGQIIRLPNFHVQREQVLQELVRQVDLEIFSPSFEVTWLDEASAFSRYLLYTFMNFLKSHHLPSELLKKIPILGRALSWPEISPRLVAPALKGHLKPPVFGLDMFQTLWNSKVSLNIDADNDPRFAINLRLFEATGVGTCLVTDWKENLPQLFALDTEVVTYKSAAECLEKVRWLLDHPRERQAIAAAGQARVLREHTFAHRAVKLDGIIKKVLGDKN